MLNLEPIDGKQSFYNKAKVIVTDDGTKTLFSYDTEICRIKPDGTFEELPHMQSQTTNRHIKAFKAAYC